jgi:3-methyladenine DNA glycosylase AlkD
MIDELRKEIKSFADPVRAKHSLRFFKTGKGQYGEGDKFYGLTVPQSRTLVRKYKNLKVSEIRKLLKSEYHEERIIGLLILVSQFQKGDIIKKEEIFNFYSKNTKYINNWDLVDVTAPKIVGRFLLDNPKYNVNLGGKVFIGTDFLKYLAKSENLWERRIAIISTFEFIYQGRSKEALEIAEILINDKHDLIHKAVGWMLREVGKRCSLEEETKFLDKHLNAMPRTMLRYAIERFDNKKKIYYMNK